MEDGGSMFRRKTKDSINAQKKVLAHKNKEKTSKKQLCFVLFKNKGMVALTSVLVFVLSLGIISFVTKTNVVTYVTERILKELGIYTTEIRNVEIESSDYSSNKPGSWHINKSAKWIGRNKVQVTFDVNSVIKTGENYKDVVLVLDISESMAGEKIEKAKNDSKELIEYLLSNSNNRVALITFDSTSEIVSNFSNDKNDLIAKIDTLTGRNNTNYNAALLNVDEVMKNYVKETNRDVVTLFLTDGVPCVDIPNQVGTFEVLKDRYPYMPINGIQYEMGLDVVEEIRQITDSAWVADQSTLNNVLFKASVSPILYENFVVTDYIENDYFEVNSVDDIEVSIGSVTLGIEDGIQKITWNLGDNSFMTGDNVQMTINLTMKDEYVGSDGYYPTNKKEKIESKLPGESLKIVDSSNTPVLKNNFEVIYDANMPDGCSIESIPREKHFVYENVTKKQIELSCNGYLFKGWEIDKNDSEYIKKVNDDVFKMPEHDVTIRATWARQSIVKSMNGTVHEKTTLYKVLQQAAEEGKYAKEYTGLHQDSMAGSGTEKVYHWYAENDADGTAILDMNNVVFAGHCWQMIRTTDTGGVKMIYNGEPDYLGKCGTSRENHVGYNGDTLTNLSGDYYYGTSYVYDKTANTFSLSGEKIQQAWNATTGPSLVGKYTCKNSVENGTCSTLYYVESYYDTSNGYVLQLKGNSNYSQIGTVQFNVNYDSPSYVGYMYNKVYNTKSMSNAGSGEIEYQTEPVLSNEYNVTANDALYPYEYDETTKTWNSTSNTTNNTSKIEFSPVSSGDYYISYSVIDSSNKSAVNIYVNNILKVKFNGTDNSSVRLGTIGVNDVIKFEFVKDFYTSYDASVKFSLARKTGEGADNRWYFGNDVEYKDGMYVLKNTVQLDLRTDYDKLDNNHYSCLNEEIKYETGEIKCSKIKYIYFSNRPSFYYIELTNGTKIGQALEEMLIDNNNVNKTNSTIKSAVDAWYEMNMLDYSDYLEDTVFCNERGIRTINGWNQNGGSTALNLLFKEYRDKDLNCVNVTDRFSVSNEKAKLKYKVGLMNRSEIYILNNNNITKTGQTYWLMSPSNYTAYFAGVKFIYRDGDWDTSAGVNTKSGVRPAISLIPGIEYSSGDGSMDNPYVVDLEI